MIVLRTHRELSRMRADKCGMLGSLLEALPSRCLKAGACRFAQESGSGSMDLECCAHQQNLLPRVELNRQDSYQ